MAHLQTVIPFWEKWNGDRLRIKQEEVGSREFDRGWRQKALSDEEALFRENIVKGCIDNNAVMATLLDKDPRARYPSGYTTFTGVDLAIASTKSKGDYFVITTIAVSKDLETKYIVNMFRQRGLTFKEQLNKVIEYGEHFQSSLIVVENNAYQDALVQELKRTSDLPIQAFTTHAVNKNDFQGGLPRLSVEFEKQRWHLPYGDDFSKEQTGILVNELITFPIGTHDDTIMSLWFANKACELLANRMQKRIFVV